ncbi:MAG: GntP family permease [Reichenbachiella sp.]
MLSVLFVAIPVFFGMVFIILLPMAITLKKKTNKPLLLYAMSLLKGLAITHAFVPPTPELVAEIGWVVLMGTIVGILMISVPLFAKYIS